MKNAENLDAKELLEVPLISGSLTFYMQPFNIFWSKD
jgi:hypothetical protein